VVEEVPRETGLAREGPDDAVMDALFSRSPVGLHVYDPELRLVRVNPSARLMRGFSIEGMVGRSLKEVLQAVDASDAAAVERAAQQVLESGDPVLDLRMRTRRDDPVVEAVISASGFRLERDDGTVLGIAAALTDVTARVRAENGLRLLNQAAARVGTTLDVFRTADEFCRVCSPEFADTVTVDVYDTVLRGHAPTVDTGERDPTVRRAGYRSVAGAGLQGVPVVGEIDVYPPGTPHRTALDSLAPKLIRRLLPDAAWLDERRQRDARILSAGVHSLLVVPLRARGVVLGLACFYRWRNPSPFDRRDLALAEQLAAYAGQCLDNARLYSRERSVARIVASSLSRPRSKVASAMDLAHTYLPAGTGGGWFDAIPLSGARVALVAGDTTTGTADPAVMGELRAAVEALSDLDLPPDEILRRLHDRASRPESALTDRPRAETGQSAPATCLYLIYDPVSRLCTAASAGHPAPLIAHPGGRSDVLDVPPGPSLGQGLAEYRVTQRALPEGSMLLVYNAALVDAGPRAPEALQDVLEELFAIPPSSLQTACDAAAQAFAPQRPSRDAYLLLARTRTLGPDRTNAWTFPNSPGVVAEARRRVTAQLSEWGLCQEVMDNTALVASELVTNAVRYTDGPIQLRLILDDTLVCEVSDDSNTAPHLRRALDSDENGRGLFIAAQLTDRWGVRPGLRGKTLWAEQSLVESPGRAEAG
jgi:PAS domain S-box-containing protein